MGNLAELERYLDYLCEVLGRVDRGTGLKDYCRGLMLPIARKSVEPLAACSDPLHVAAKLAGVPMGIVLADAGYGDETAFRDGITELGMRYAAGIRPANALAVGGHEISGLGASCTRGTSCHARWSRRDYLLFYCS